MEPTVPAGDVERVPLSGERTQLVSVVVPALWVGALIVAGLGLLRGGGVDAPLGVVLLVLPLLGALVAWRWATPLRRVVATRTGLIVSGLGAARFVSYAAVAAARESTLTRTRTITVTLRVPVAGLRRFAFIPPYRPLLRPGDEHPVAMDLNRRLAGARDGAPDPRPAAPAERRSPP